ncbi:MAG TPA: hypothetical protein VL588_02905 [Bdellovibrionota bacterium]|jgi:hypothetical protein|nr:hypothetical protein [Bdellovibrionota bacterium]
MLTRPHGRLAFLLVALAFAAPALTARADASLDRKYGLERIGYLPAWDNVDQLFRPYVEEAFKEYFAQHPRFTLMDSSKARDTLLDSKLDYQQLMEDPAVLDHAARAVKAESLIRTKIYKEGAQYRVVMDWLHAPQMETLASSTSTISEPGPGQDLSPQDLKAEIKRGIGGLIAKLPFVGHVTGKDSEWITVSVARNAGIRKGDHLIVSTIEEVKVHPILKAVVDWRMEKIGVLEVDSVDGGMAFCKAVEEDPARPIARYQKITSVAHAAEPVESPKPDGTPAEVEPPIGPPKLGWIEAGPVVGSADRQVSTTARSVEGSGFLIGGRVDGQVWLNRELFVELGTSYGTFSSDQKDLSPTAGANPVSTGATVFSWHGALGYTYLLSDDFYGPKGWAKLGFLSSSTDMASSTTNLTGGTSIGGLYVGVGGDLPIRGGWGVTLGLDIGIFNGGTLTGFTTGGADGVTSVRFNIGASYLLGPRLAVKGLIRVQTQSADFGSDSSVSHRVIDFTPTLVYFF